MVVWSEGVIVSHPSILARRETARGFCLRVVGIGGAPLGEALVVLRGGWRGKGGGVKKYFMECTTEGADVV